MRHRLSTFPAQVAFERPDRKGGGGTPANRPDPDEPLVPLEPEWDPSSPSALDSFFAEAVDPELPANTVPAEAATTRVGSPAAEGRPAGEAPRAGARSV